MVPSFDIEGVLYMLSRSLQVTCPMLKYLFKMQCMCRLDPTRLHEMRLQ